MEPQNDPQQHNRSKGQGPFKEWTKEEVQSWITNDLDLGDYASKFLLSGKHLGFLKREDCVERCNEFGDVIYRAIKEQNSGGSDSSAATTERPHTPSNINVRLPEEKDYTLFSLNEFKSKYLNFQTYKIWLVINGVVSSLSEGINVEEYSNQNIIVTAKDASPPDSSEFGSDSSATSSTAPKLITNGLPQLGSGSGSESKPSISNFHPATLKPSEFKCFENPEWLTPDNSAIWGSSVERGWSSEADIQYFIRNVMDEVILMTGLKEQLRCTNELSVFDLRPDIWIVTYLGHPLGVVEVKRPSAKNSESILNEPKVLGQLYDYMLRLSSFHGLKNVFGILTTYEEWRICWFPSAQHVAEDTVLPRINEEKNRELDSEPDLDQITDDSDGDEAEVILEDPKTRILYGTDVIAWNHKQLVRILFSVVLKMYASRTSYEHVERISKQRPYIKLTKTSWFWVKLTKIPKLNFRKTPNQRTNLLLLEDFRNGADGRVWLACSMKGEVCVLKFALSNSSHQGEDLKLEYEATNWNKLDFAEVKVQTWGGQPALVMPYARPMTQSELQEKKALVTESLKNMTKAGLCHDDLALRHVGYFSPKKKNEKGKVVFIDLARMRNVEEEEAGDALQRMLKKLNIDE